MSASNVDEDLFVCLDQGLEALAMVLSDDAKHQLVNYIGLLHKWNKVHNFTSLKNPVAMMKRHVLDSLALVHHIKGSNCLDVGSGPGLPGIPLAIACPDKQLYLLESRLKRVIFLRHCVGNLALSNVHVLHTRLEDYHPEQKHEAVLARAFCPPEDFLERIAHVIESGGTAYLQVGEQLNQGFTEKHGGKILPLCRHQLTKNSEQISMQKSTQTMGFRDKNAWAGKVWIVSS